MIIKKEYSSLKSDSLLAHCFVLIITNPFLAVNSLMVELLSHYLCGYTCFDVALWLACVVLWLVIILKLAQNMRPLAAVVGCKQKEIKLTCVCIQN